MTHYAKEPHLVRVDRFRASGKWYDTWQIDMRLWFEHPDLVHAVKMCWEEAYLKAFGVKSTPMTSTITGLNVGWVLVCMDPYHRNSHPILLRSEPIGE